MAYFWKKQETRLSPEDAEGLLISVLGREPVHSGEVEMLTGQTLEAAARRLFRWQGFQINQYQRVLYGQLPQTCDLDPALLPGCSNFLTRHGGKHTPGGNWLAYLIAFYKVRAVKKALTKILSPKGAKSFTRGLHALAKSPPEPSIPGEVEIRQTGQIAGWILPEAPNVPRNLKILVNDRLRATATANLLRRDITGVPDTMTNCGFDLALKAIPEDLTEKPLVLIIRDGNTDKLLFAPMEIQPSGINALSDLKDIRHQIKEVQAFGTSSVAQADKLGHLLVREKSLVSLSNYPLCDYDVFVKNTEPSTPSQPITQITVIELDGPYPTKDMIAEADAADRPYLLFLPQNDRVSDASLARLDIAAKTGAAPLIYSDHDYYDQETDNYSCPHLKAGFDYDLMLQTAYIGPSFIIDRVLFLELGGFAPTAQSAVFHDLALRAYERLGKNGFQHVGTCLWHRNTTGDQEVQLADLQRTTAAHFGRMQLQATVEIPSPEKQATFAPHLKINWAAQHPLQQSTPDQQPRMAIIIPTRDRTDLLRACVTSLEHTLALRDKTEILIIDNDSIEEETHTLFAEYEKAGTARVISYKGDFNWSAQNNLAASQTDAELLVFLNNDATANDYGWDLTVRALLDRSDIGLVGPRLLFEDGTLQQGGLIFYDTADGRIEGLGEPASFHGYLDRRDRDHACAALIGAFMAMRHDTFTAAKGFNADDLSVTYNDYDMCFRIREQGLTCLYTPQFSFTHLGWETRGNEDLVAPDQIKRAKREYDNMKTIWGHLDPIDPYYPPAFARNGRPFSRLDSLFRLEGQR
ncbi:hypothetical protein GCM10017044_11330 [Kordiimonas sediminis]|uniref:Glycosyltransferase 2-like domain-containing protein n=1 Tax=Kordiimonas sediminis TaxID=1735581 RepID=A0A919AQG2_9PROT|nr:glycosyltransferase [Kordiimonas sediminis]GHF18539.1 hypothetical protein GCM10017044_11330 [Kordiimonas sediminis]